MSADPAFLKSIVRGDLVLALRWNSSKVHILRVLYSKHSVNDDKKDDPGLQLWMGRTFCPLKANYYFRPQTSKSMEQRERCEICFARHRSNGSPVVKGWTDDGAKVPSAEWPLPFGWKEMPTIGHPWDVPEGGDVESILDKEGKSVGEMRAERRRFQRGHCVVRLVEYFGEDAGSFGALYHDTARVRAERWSAKGPLKHCMRRAWEMMAKGGRP